MAISAIGGFPAIQPIDFPKIDSTPKTGGASGFGDKLTGAIDGLQKTQATSDNLATQVATGQLTDIADYMIAANQAEIGTQLTVAVKNKAVDAFNQIMNMQV